MAGTDSIVEQDSALSDFEVFVDPCSFFKTGGSGAISAYGSGTTSYIQFANFNTVSVTADVTAAIKRTGMGISPKSTQQGYPPMKGSQLTTVAGPITTAPKKGIMINSVDIPFSGNAAIGANAITLTLAVTNFIDNAAPVVNTLINAVGNAGPLVQNYYRKNWLVANPSFIITPDSEVVLGLAIDTNTVSVALILFGAVLKCSCNFN